MVANRFISDISRLLKDSLDSDTLLEYKMITDKTPMTANEKETLEAYRKLTDGYLSAAVPFDKISGLILLWMRSGSIPSIPQNREIGDDASDQYRNAVENQNSANADFDIESLDRFHYIRETLRGLTNMDKEDRQTFFALAREGNFENNFKLFFRNFRNVVSGEKEHEVQRLAGETDWKRNIRLIHMSPNYIVWGTKTYQATTYKFISVLWDTNEPTQGNYGDYKAGSPYCTKQLEHWKNYARDFGDEYEQFWVFENPFGGTMEPDTCQNDYVENLLERMKGMGPRLLIGQNDSNGDILNREDVHFKGWIDEELKQLFDRLVPDVFSVRGVLRVKQGALREMQELVVPDGTEIINFFGQAPNLKRVVIPDSVLKIGYEAFRRCHNLESVEFSENSQLMEIAGLAFFGTGIKSISLPRRLQLIGSEAFSSCDDLTEVSIPPHVRVIGDEAFYACRGLKSVTFEAGSQLKSIGKWAFHMTNVGPVDLPDGLEEVGKRAFDGQVELPPSVKLVPGMHMACGKTLVLKDWMKHVPANFYESNDLRDIWIPDGVGRIDEKAITVNHVNIVSIHVSRDFDVSAIDDMAIRRSYGEAARTMVVRHKDWNAALAAATGETAATLESLCLDAFLG